jgi:hypothetical protein
VVLQKRIGRAKGYSTEDWSLCFKDEGSIRKFISKSASWSASWKSFFEVKRSGNGKYFWKEFAYFLNIFYIMRSCWRSSAGRAADS